MSQEPLTPEERLRARLILEMVTYRRSRRFQTYEGLLEMLLLVIEDEFQQRLAAQEPSKV